MPTTLTRAIPTAFAGVSDGPEPVWTLRQLSDAGYGTRQRLTQYIHDGELRASFISGAYRVSDSDLQLFMSGRSTG